MPIYDYNIQQATIELLPPNKRKTNNIAYLGAPGNLLQKYHTLFFKTYAKGNFAPVWVSGGTYSYEQQVRYTENDRYNNKIYELKNKNGITGVTTPPNVDTGNWVLVQNNFVGASERARYHSGKLAFEFALNKWFKTSFRQPPLVSDIFISKDPIDNYTFIIGNDEPSSSVISYNDSEQSFFINDSYITNSIMFSINLPLAVYDSLVPSASSGYNVIKENIIRSFADNYVLGGITYNIKTY